MKYLRVLLGLFVAAVTIVFLVIALQNLDLAKAWSEFLKANYLWIIPGVGVYFLAVVARTWRWFYLLRPLKPTRPLTFGALFRLVVIGYMGNNIYPARAGEILRSYVLRQRNGIPISVSLATVFVERIFDGVVMLLFVFIALPFTPGLPEQIRTTVELGSVAFFGALVAFLWLAAHPTTAANLAHWFTDRIVPARFRPAVREFTERFLEGLAGLREPRDVLMVFMTSLVIWLTETVKYWFVTFAFGIQWVPFYALMLMNGIVNLSTTIPTALPGYVGTFDLPGIAVLKAYGVPDEKAAAYTLILHVALWLPVTLLGLWYMASEGLSWKSVSTEAAQEKTEQPEPAPAEGSQA